MLLTLVVFKLAPFALVLFAFALLTRMLDSPSPELPH
jgi:hypothetical protein